MGNQEDEGNWADSARLTQLDDIEIDNLCEVNGIRISSFYTVVNKHIELETHVEIFELARFYLKFKTKTIAYFT